MVNTVNVGDTFDVEIEGIGSKGDGIAKIEGLAIIVQESKIIGEHMKVKITNVREKFAFAEIVENYGRDGKGSAEETEEPKEEEKYEDTEDFGEAAEEESSE